LNVNKKRRRLWVYFLGLAFGFGGAAFGFAFAATGFIGAPQQTISDVSHPHGSSTKTTSPQVSHLYLSPFLFAKNNTCLEISLYY